MLVSVADDLTHAQDLLAYIGHGRTAFHAVAETEGRLQAAGFEPLSELDVWHLEPGSRHYVTRGDASIIAFHVGKDAPARAGFKMVGAHTDSPNLKLKPRPNVTAHGFCQAGVEIYGGVLLSTWLDRDLSIAGRLAVRTSEGVSTVLFDVERPLLRVSNLAIHLNRDVNKDGLKLNAQTHMAPIWGLEGEKVPKGGIVALLAASAGVDPADVIDHDASLYDVQPGAIIGFDDAFIASARLDNLASCHAALSGMLGATYTPGSATRLIVFYDHEEVGSRSAHGAAGPFLRTVLQRIVDAHPKQEPQAFARAMAASFLVSADMAHAVHPNYADRHEPQHMPRIGGGPVVKSNANQSYATDGASAAEFIAVCRSAGVEPQNFVARTDLGCGSTIGPITAAELGVRTVDVGNPMLSMHSAREVAGARDVARYAKVLEAFLATA